MLKFICFFLLFNVYAFSQTIFLEGKVLDSNNKPLQNANIIAKPLSSKNELKFSIADYLGRYRLELEKNISYEIKVTYLGFDSISIILSFDSPLKEYNFELKQSEKQLEEIIIKYDYQPIIVKNDTLIYDIKAFTNGSERKMKEVLEKLPGVEVDKNGKITLNGKEISKLLVEGKLFFGGGSKLAVDNIPADALDKIEFIDKYNEVAFLKDFSENNDLALNVKLKKDKKNFVFGDLEAGKGEKGYYMGHIGMFYYNPKQNVSFIGDSNNIGKQTLTFADLLRFEGGVNSILSERKPLSNLYSFTNNNTDIVESKSKFGALNFSKDFNSKVNVEGYSLFSKLASTSLSVIQNQYIQNDNITFEKRINNSFETSISTIGNLKLNYTPANNEKWFYNLYFQKKINTAESSLNLNNNSNNSSFITTNELDSFQIKQYFEWDKKFNKKYTSTFILNQLYEDQRPENIWATNTRFFSGLIPIVQDDSYNIQQLKSINNNNFDLLFKNYFIINNSNHIYINVGNTLNKTSLKTFEKQILTNGRTNDFYNNGFGNIIDYLLNDFYFGIQYKFKIGKLLNTASIYNHSYKLKTNQISNSYNLNSDLIELKMKSEFQFNSSERLEFNYKLSNDFPNVNQLNSRFTIQNFNTVYKGNSILSNEKFNSMNLAYNKMNIYKGFAVYMNLNYNKKIRNIRNEILLDGINQFITPVINNNPDISWLFLSNISKKFYKFRFELFTNLSLFNYTQTLNNVITTNDRNSQTTGISVKTASKKWPDFSVGYSKGFNQIKGITYTEFKNDAFNTAFEATILKSWIFKIEYENLKNTNNSNQSNYYDIANSSLRYQKKNSPFGFELTANNFLDNKVKNNYSFSDFVISEQATYVLPRVFMFSVSYKL